MNFDTEVVRQKAQSDQQGECWPGRESVALMERYEGCKADECREAPVSVRGIPHENATDSVKYQYLGNGAGDDDIQRHLSVSRLVVLVSLAARPKATSRLGPLC